MTKKLNEGSDMSIVIIDDYFKEDEIPEISKKKRDEVWAKVIKVNIPIQDIYQKKLNGDKQ